MEHGITEYVNNSVDLVEWMIRLQLPVAMSSNFEVSTSLLSFEHSPKGHSIEVRLCAENPLNDFSPSPGNGQIYLICSIHGCFELIT